MDIINEYFTTYYQLNYKNFIQNYEITLSEFTEILRHKNVDFDDLSTSEIEGFFLKELIKAVTKKNFEINKKSKERNEIVFKKIGVTEEEYFNLDSEKFNKYHKLLIEVSKEVTDLNEKETIFLTSFNSKIHFLGNKLNKAGISYRVLNDETIVFNQKENDKEKSIETKPLIDLSESKGTEKIIMLQQLGVLDFLKSKQPFIQSTNKLAEAISGFTGINSGTVQSYINPMNDNTTNQKNNPMTKLKTVTKVNQKLISIGYNPPQ
ncbi:hypothetical protein [Winogradskyella ursingii]|uniref:hypothetical protein n=1 Tax=Winogradskyella ursingii TaxID=2686079 RepID=UPI0015CDB202|nr:hypothetical protein [Winogradskyella ursingii]